MGREKKDSLAERGGRAAVRRSSGVGMPRQRACRIGAVGFAAVSLAAPALAGPPVPCCFQDGSCAEVDPFVCATAAGQVVAACGDCEGACCVGGGTCLTLAPAPCAGAGGLFLGLAVDCPGAFCTGGCWVAAGACVELSAAACAGAGGGYLGDGSTCTACPLACPPDAERSAIAWDVPYFFDLSFPGSDDVPIPAAPAGITVLKATVEIFGSAGAIAAAVNESSLPATNFFLVMDASVAATINLPVPPPARTAMGTIVATCPGVPVLPPAPPGCAPACLAGCCPSCAFGFVGFVHQSALVTCSMDPIELALLAGGGAVVHVSGSGNLDLNGNVDMDLEVSQFSAQGIVRVTYEYCAAGVLKGRCCLPDGTCLVIPEAACLALMGTPDKPGTVCFVGACPQPTGACCFPDGSCLDLTADGCVMMGGIFYGGLTSCADPGIECRLPKGACCFADGSCAVMIERACDAGGGAYLGDFTTCAGMPCDEPAGACCIPGMRCEDLFFFECLVAGGYFQGNLTECKTITCAPVKGACCLPGSSCVVTTQSICRASGGAYMGDDTICVPSPCTPLGTSPAGGSGP